MAATLAFDHVVILVHDLEKASADYRVLGFTVFYGGQHADGKTHNALIVFQDGTYIELLAPTDPRHITNVDPNDRSSFLFVFGQGEGFGGYALRSQDLEADMTRMQQHGLHVQRRPPGGRARPDGQELRWRSAMLEGTMTPFFIQDDTPHNLRVPDASDRVSHENGVKGIASFKLPAPDLDKEIAFYQVVLGHELYPLNPNSDPDPVTQAMFSAPPCTIIIDSQLQDTRLDLIYEYRITPQNAGLPSPGFVELDTRLTHGVRIALHPF